MSDEDAEAVRADVRDGPYGTACGVILNRLISLGDAVPGSVAA